MRSVHLKRKLHRFLDEVECWMSNDRSPMLQADVFRREAENLKFSQSLKMRVAQLQARCNDFWRDLKLTQFSRDGVHYSPELEWMHMEEKQPESGATGAGRMCADDTTFPSYFAAAGDRLPVHLNNSSSAACPGDPRQHLKVPKFLWGSSNES